MEQKSAALDELVEEVAVLLEATVRVEEGIFHLAVPISAGGGGEGDEDEEGNEGAEGAKSADEDPASDDDGEAGEDDDEPTLQVNVALSTSEDGAALFVTRRLCALDDSLDLEGLLREVSGTVHVQLSIDEDNDVVLGSAAPITAGAEWIADMIGELAEFAPDLAEDASPAEETT